MKKLLKKILCRKLEIAASLRGDENPQVKEIYFNVCGEINALQSVLDYLEGRKYMLNCMLGRIDV